MFVQIRNTGGTDYVYIVRSVREKGKKNPHQETVQCLGRLEDRIKEDPEYIEKLKEDLRKPEERVIVDLVCSKDRTESAVLIGNLPIEAAVERIRLLKAFDGIEGKADYRIPDIARDVC